MPPDNTGVWNRRNQIRRQYFSGLRSLPELSFNRLHDWRSGFTRKHLTAEMTWGETEFTQAKVQRTTPKQSRCFALTSIDLLCFPLLLTPPPNKLFFFSTVINVKRIATFIRQIDAATFLRQPSHFCNFIVRCKTLWTNSSIGNWTQRTLWTCVLRKLKCPMFRFAVERTFYDSDNKSVAAPARQSIICNAVIIKITFNQTARVPFDIRFSLV